MPNRRKTILLAVTGAGSLVAIAIVGGVSYFLGLGFGETALQGVTPLQDTGNPETATRRIGIRRTVPLADESQLIAANADILKPPANRLLAEGAPIPTPEPTVTPRPTPPPQAGATPTSTPTPRATLVPAPTLAPVATPVPTGGVVMRVLSAQKQGGSVVLNVTLQNNSGRIVRFLYSFMDVTDDRGRPISASTQGLPGEVPPNGQSYSGTVRIPAIFLNGSRTVSLSLPDYPSQAMRLRVSNVPLPQ
ncbi:hypothetical protein [Synechococcus sp. PCC 7336]|uniref:hypothetical protein n=1 Tax=Synechococcus sp. PCC 7336 TaxID=195250 RepID=UPI00036D3DE7|nr:hypothetical protein [Synechococcus sp. PCC 7336]